ncbi:hypothetical protein QYE76_039473 [Lolium multiflorum]|uniref:DUF8039 domain-containing protein n=1 Tax=Lolium multiflorum TaxID=4521 RepID=A0AAD8T9Y7_LOLMU|nr:hypothetical protein QYE76_039473 [Lolium multiflorum]
MKAGETCTIDVVDEETGRPLEPSKNATKFVSQCGAVVRDNVSITRQEWNEPKKARVGFTFVDREKKIASTSLWNISFYLRNTANTMRRPSAVLYHGALHHNNPIQDGYARVTVEEIVQGFEDLDIDIATPEGVKRLGDVKRQFILWQKKFIKQALAFKNRKELAEKKALKDEAESKLERGKKLPSSGNKLFNLRDLDKSIISCYVLMKKREMRIRNIHDVGFIDPHIVNSYVLEHHPADVEEDLWRFIRKQQEKSDILFPYHFGFHWILMVIKVQTSSVLVHDSLNMDPALWGDMRKMMQKFLVVKSGVDDMNVGTIFESRDATFFEDIFPMRDMHGMSSWESDPIHETPMESDEESDDESSDSDEDNNEAPTRKALASPDADYWKEAVQSEMDSILANETWELSERPYGCKL